MWSKQKFQDSSLYKAEISCVSHINSTLQFLTIYALHCQNHDFPLIKKKVIGKLERKDNSSCFRKVTFDLEMA